MPGSCSGTEIRLTRSVGVIAFGAVCVAIYPLAFYTSMRVGGVALGTVVSLASAPMASAIIERVLDERALTVRWMIACAVGNRGQRRAVHDGR